MEQAITVTQGRVPHSKLQELLDTDDTRYPVADEPRDDYGTEDDYDAHILAGLVLP